MTGGRTLVGIGPKLRTDPVSRLPAHGGLYAQLPMRLGHIVQDICGSFTLSAFTLAQYPVDELQFRDPSSAPRPSS